MARIKRPPGTGDLALPRSKGNFLTKIDWRGLYVAKWPRRWRKRDRCSEYREDIMYVAAEMAKYTTPLEMEAALEWQKGSNDTWKDAIIRAQFATLFRVVDEFGNVYRPAPRPCPVIDPPEPSDMTWILRNQWSHATHGNIVNFDTTDLEQYQELLIIMQAVTTTGATFRLARASIDNGATFYSGAAHYTAITNGFSGGTQTGFFFSTGQSAAAAYGALWIPNLTLEGVQKVGIPLHAAGWSYWLNQTTAKVNAIRVCNSAASNMTGGIISVLAR